MMLVQRWKKFNSTADNLASNDHFSLSFVIEISKLQVLITTEKKWVEKMILIFVDIGTEFHKSPLRPKYLNVRY